MYPIISLSISLTIFNLFEYGQTTNPCVNMESYKKADRMDEIFFNEKFDCYSTKYPSD